MVFAGILLAVIVVKSILKLGQLLVIVVADNRGASKPAGQVLQYASCT